MGAPYFLPFVKTEYLHLPRLGRECTTSLREVCELALAHVNSDRVEAAYRRSDLFERRRTLMLQWAEYLAASA